MEVQNEEKKVWRRTFRVWLPFRSFTWTDCRETKIYKHNLRGIWLYTQPVCTVHSCNLFFSLPAVAASENCWFVMLQLKDFYLYPLQPERIIPASLRSTASTLLDFPHLPSSISFSGSWLPHKHSVGDIFDNSEVLPLSQCDMISMIPKMLLKQIYHTSINKSRNNTKYFLTSGTSNL